jgi:flagellar motor switch protein FliM
MVMVAGFELGIGDLRGMMRLCLPHRAIERMDEQGSPENRSPADRPPADLLAAVEVTLAETPIAGSDLTGLRVGDIISTETEAGSPAIVSIAGVAKFRAKPGVYQGHKAAVLVEEIEEPPLPLQDRPTGPSPADRGPE